MIVAAVQISRSPSILSQLSYIGSAALIGLFLTIVGVGLLVTADLHDEWRKLDRIEAAIRATDAAPVAPTASVAERPRLPGGTGLGLLAPGTVHGPCGRRPSCWRSSAPSGSAVGFLRTSRTLDLDRAFQGVAVSVTGLVALSLAAAAVVVSLRREVGLRMVGALGGWSTAAVVLPGSSRVPAPAAPAPGSDDPVLLGPSCAGTTGRPAPPWPGSTRCPSPGPTSTPPCDPAGSARPPARRRPRGGPMSDYLPFVVIGLIHRRGLRPGGHGPGPDLHDLGGLQLRPRRGGHVRHLRLLFAAGRRRPPDGAGRRPRRARCRPGCWACVLDRVLLRRLHGRRPGHLRRRLPRSAGRPAGPGHQLYGAETRRWPRCSRPAPSRPRRRQRRLRPDASSCVIAVAAALGLVAFFRFTHLGLQTRAVVERPRPGRARRRPTPVGSPASPGCSAPPSPPCRASCSPPSCSSTPLLLTLLVVQAFGAAVVGRLRSLPLTYLGAYGIAIAAALFTKFVATASPAWPALPTALPFIVLFVVLVVQPQGQLRRGHQGPGTRPGRRPDPPDEPVPWPGLWLASSPSRLAAARLPRTAPSSSPPPPRWPSCSCSPA